jgi:hypothetical protein
MAKKQPRNRRWLRLRTLLGVVGLKLVKVGTGLIDFAVSENGAAENHIRATVKLADWPVEFADALIEAEMPPSTVAKMFATTLDRPQ